jgi:hypothetical protein
MVIVIGNTQLKSVPFTPLLDDWLKATVCTEASVVTLTGVLARFKRNDRTSAGTCVIRYSLPPSQSFAFLFATHHH